MRAVAFGEVLWDIIDGEAHLGGAPFNLAAHLAQTGAEVYIVSSVGNDDLGRRILQEARGKRVHTELVSVLDDHPTGTVDVDVDEHGQPSYTIHEGVAWDHISLSEEAAALLRPSSWDAFAFGTLAQRSATNRRLLNELFAHVKSRHVYYDVNLRQDYYRRAWIETSLSHSTIVKLNRAEADELSSMLFGTVLDVRDFVSELLATYTLEVVIVTDGPKGALVYDGESFHHTSADESVQVADTVGAGDSFSAAFLFAYCAAGDAFAAGDFAGRVADFVVSRSGAIPDYPETLEKEIARIAAKH